MIHYSLADSFFYLIFYSFIGWSAEIVYSAIKQHQFINKGFLNLPVKITYGICTVILIHTFPTMNQNFFLQIILAFIVFHVLWSIAEIFVQRICGLKEIETSNIPTLNLKSQFLFEITASLCIAIVILIIHPFIHGFLRLVPDSLMNVLATVLATLIVIDFISVIYSVSTKKLRKKAIHRKEDTQNLATQLSDSIWKRLNKAYPGILENSSVQSLIFAKGLCFDKIIWIFLVSAFLGALIEMCYCRIAGDVWMNRSSLLYGSFSVVWGIGAVVLTITLKPIANKSYLLLFLAGFFIGGAYEYICSIFTELVFGTVFWDYSHMKLSIGGRTNVIYCIFWGILAIVWMKVLYPIMEKEIEKISPLYGKIITWVIVFVLVFDGLLTCGAMIRYTNRQTSPVPANAIDNFFDMNYDDEWMEHRWPNMKVTYSDKHVH